MSTTHVHRLVGCAPTPLAHYLKALGILRLVSEGPDRTARGWWQDEAFSLSTTLDREALARFFLYDYHPTPMISPWNGGSGFYPGDQQRGIRALEQTRAPRFQAFREAIASGRALAGRFPDTPEGKEALLRACRQQWRGPLLTWFDAALVLTGDGTPRYPSLLGTGGNDGRLDFPNNYMQRLADLFNLSAEPDPTQGNTDEPSLPPDTQPLLEATLFGGAATGLVDKAIGQFFPGGAGGANSNAGFGGGSSFNPWDFVLMLEGALLFASSVVRRAEAKEAPQAAAPFATYADAIGYGTATDKEKRSRGEQWMPLWSRPATAPEIKAMIAEGRSRMTTNNASRPVDFAKAVARLGVARGITAFQRYGYLERQGQANLAIPIGRWTVPRDGQPNQNLLDDTARWIQSLAGAASDENAPNAFRSTARRCQEAELACTRDGSSSAHWQALLLALADAELQMIRSPAFTGRKNLRPLPRLSYGWVHVIKGDNGEHKRLTEFRLGLALACQHGSVCTNRVGALARPEHAKDSIEAHWLPLEPGKRIFAKRDEKLAFDHGVVCHGRDLIDDCLALLHRRLIELHQNKYPEAKGLMPLLAVPGIEVKASDLAEFIACRVDDEKILRFALALMALKWNEVPASSTFSSNEEWNSLYCLFRLNFLPTPLYYEGEQFKIVPDAAIIGRLAAGGANDLTHAAKIALRRLRVTGLRPKFRVVAGGGKFTRRLAASLAFGLSWRTATSLAHRIVKPSFDSPNEPSNSPEPTDDTARPLPA